jgi:hypothetical protein
MLLSIISMLPPLLSLSFFSLGVVLLRYSVNNRMSCNSSVMRTWTIENPPGWNSQVCFDSYYRKIRSPFWFYRFKYTGTFNHFMFWFFVLRPRIMSGKRP